MEGEAGQTGLLVTCDLGFQRRITQAKMTFMAT